MFYIITDVSGKLEGKFFATREQAETYQEENYFVCTGDVREVKLED